MGTPSRPQFSIVPRLNLAAGFELGTGMFINPALPEVSAAFLRDIDLSNGVS